ncbi:hypothetical protein Tdes44962_MAKER06148 [Teratosphaeria destructans]|uniref:Rhodopsin domain-containing protein n=1 Tax=Teratosphaeria destructans TaxID=418781 RepID=A0A9W7SIP2_9PEZI|nr:hypothetical protein Tdes44962_MAKER06148 [Teratosphaeria destructans]
MTPFADNAPHVAGAVYVLLVFGFTALGLRVWCRVSTRNWGWDDWSILIAAPLFAALSAACLGGSYHGLGVHEASLDYEQKKSGMMFFFLFEIFWCLSVVPTKLSISFMLMRVAGPLRTYTWLLWGMSALFTVMDLVAFFYIVFQCTPVSYAWDTDTPGGFCRPSYILADIYYATTAVNIVTDWFVALLPIPLLWSVPLNTNAKLSVFFLFSLGVLASVAGCIRLKYTVSLTNSGDYLHSVANVVIWGYAEVGIGFFVSCLGTLRPLFKRALKLGVGQSSLGKAVQETSGEPNFELTPQGQYALSVSKNRAVLTTRTQTQEPRSGSEESLVQDLRKEGIYITKSYHQASEVNVV